MGPPVERLVFVLGGLLLGMILTGWILPVRFSNNAETSPTRRKHTVNNGLKARAAEYELTEDEDEVARKLTAAGYGVEDVRELAKANESAQVGSWLANIEDIAASAINQPRTNNLNIRGRHGGARLSCHC